MGVHKPPVRCVNIQQKKHFYFSCDWDDECLSKYQKCDDNKYVFDAHKYTKTLCELQNNYEINSKITKKAHEWIVSTSKCIQVRSLLIFGARTT